MISNIVLLILGFAVNVLWERYQLQQSGKPFLFAEHVWKFLLSFVFGVALLVMGPELITALGVTISEGQDAVFMKFHAFFMCGLFPLVIFKRIVGMIKVFTGNGNGK